MKSGSPLLKPLLEQIKRFVPNADYLQLHVALKNNPDEIEVMRAEPVAATASPLH
ncbi:MAG: hypothetical protein AB7U63_19445 [Porticoccaceae bacterium]